MTKLTKPVTRETEITVSDGGQRKLMVTLNDNHIEIRAKGLSTKVVWFYNALYEQGIKEGRIR